jgi:pyruvate dehydrogenase E2 component (dihydrolipoamide acetyltransferase)
MPALSPTMEEGKLAKWLVKEGDEVHSGDILAEIETDKATMEFEAVDEGKIGKLLVPEGTEGVKVNAPIAELLGGDDEEGDEESSGSGNTDVEAAMQSIKSAVDAHTSPSPPQGERVGVRGSAAPAEEAKAPVTSQDEKTKPESAPSSASRPLTPALSPSGGEGARGVPKGGEGDRVFASPLARRIAEQKGLDLSALKGSGPRGRIVKADVEGAKPQPQKPSFGARADARAPQDDASGARHPEVQAQPAPKGGMVAPLPDARAFFKEGDYEEVPHDGMRKAIAKRLTSSKTLIPHFYLTIDCRIDNLMETRARLNAASPKENGFKLSVNDFVVKACALALMRVPEVNASWTDTAILRHKHADVGVAVALDFGLITPIVSNAEGKGLGVISNEVKSLAERARAKKLKPQEFEGGSFAVSNLGMFGIRDFTGVINPPHAAILAVGAGEQRAVVKDGAVAVATVMTVTMSCDHRVVDGATGARFLAAFKGFIEEPASMLL